VSLSARWLKNTSFIGNLGTVHGSIYRCVQRSFPHPARRPIPTVEFASERRAQNTLRFRTIIQWLQREFSSTFLGRSWITAFGFMASLASMLRLLNPNW
jgi:hypothetical protein